MRDESLEAALKSLARTAAGRAEGREILRKAKDPDLGAEGKLALATEAYAAVLRASPDDDDAFASFTAFAEHLAEVRAEERLDFESMTDEQVDAAMDDHLVSIFRSHDHPHVADLFLNDRERYNERQRKSEI